MIRLFSLVMFHLKIFSKNNYFITLLVTSTISMILIQYTIAYSSNNLNDNTIWVRSAIFGMWNIAITSAGAISFQRFQGTLPYLFNNVISDQISLISLLIPVSIFGILAFPLSYLICFLLNISVNISANLFLGIFFLYIGVMSMTFIIAALFVLTKNAIVYEQLATIPVLILSGVFVLPENFNQIIDLFSWVMPITAPIRYLLGYSTDFILKSFFTSLIWIIIAYYLSKKILNSSKNNGNMEVF